MRRRSNTITIPKVRKLAEKSARLIEIKVTASASPYIITEAEVKFDRRRTQLITTTALNALGITEKTKRNAIQELTQTMGNEYGKHIFYGKELETDKLDKYRKELISLLGGRETYNKFVDFCKTYVEVINAVRAKLTG